MPHPRPRVKPAAVPPSSSDTVGPEAYTRWRGTTLGAVTEALEHRVILELAGSVDGARVLDLGCGDGLLTRTLAARGARTVGLDIDRAMLRAAIARAEAPPAQRAQFVQGRIEQLPFPDAVFDTVAAVTVLCFVPDPTTALREIARVLRPGGHMVIGDLGRWSAWAVWRRVRAWLGSRLWRAVHFRTVAELSALVERAGMSVVAARGSVYYPPVGFLARALAHLDRWLGPLTTAGAAFIALAAMKANANDVPWNRFRHPRGGGDTCRRSLPLPNPRDPRLVNDPRDPRPVKCRPRGEMTLGQAVVASHAAAR
jgi:SAM-dependent methyltransferase